MSKYKYIVIEAENILWDRKCCGLESAPGAVKLFDGVSDALQEFRQNKKHVIALTEMETEAAEDLASKSGLMGCLESVQGANVQGEVVPWPDIFNRLRENQTKNGRDINPSNTIMLLSSVKGVSVASKQGFLVIGVASDDAVPSELMDAGADVVAPFPGSVSHAVVMVENLRKNVVSSVPKAEKLQHA